MADKEQLEAIVENLIGVLQLQSKELAGHITAAEIEKLKRTLPGEIRSLWPDEVQALSL